ALYVKGRDAMVKKLTISEVGRAVGLRPSAIRYCESTGVLPPPKRINGRRCYDNDVLQRLAIIQLAQKAGFTIAEINGLFSDFEADTPAMERWQALATQKLAEMEALIMRTQKMKHILEESLLRCRCLTLDECGPLIRERRNGAQMSS
ncbi:MAG: MerR family transcriptional regulator, partial [Ktedonobacterales bacterium]